MDQGRFQKFPIFWNLGNLADRSITLSCYEISVERVQMALDVLRQAQSGPLHRLFERDGTKYGYLGGMGVSYPPTNAQVALEELIESTNSLDLANVFELAAINSNEILQLYLEKESILRGTSSENNSNSSLDEVEERIRQSNYWSPIGLFYLYIGAKHRSCNSSGDMIQLIKIIQTLSINADLCQLLNLRIKDKYSGCILRTTSYLEEMKLDDTFCDYIAPNEIAAFFNINIDNSNFANCQYDVFTLRGICELPADAGELKTILGVDHDETITLWLQFRRQVINFRQNLASRHV